MSTHLADLNGRWWDWRVDVWDGRSLRLIADNDLTYHYAVAVTFEEARYVACPMEFSHPTFRPPTSDEVARVTSALEGDLDGLAVFAWDTDADEPGASCVVAARNVTVEEGLVLLAGDEPHTHS